jgi:hypothetical protein
VLIFRIKWPVSNFFNAMVKNKNGFDNYFSSLKRLMKSIGKLKENHEQLHGARGSLRRSTEKIISLFDLATAEENG